ncbi:MAG: helix-turn-helix domain-containing protein [Solirubrobacteraceae bacterium]
MPGWRRSPRDGPTRSSTSSRRSCTTGPIATARRPGPHAGWCFANGLTPHAFQRELRIEHARALLGAGMPAAAVAATCGFADQPHLSRVFQRLVGVPPGAYARAAVRRGNGVRRGIGRPIS